MTSTQLTAGVRTRGLRKTYGPVRAVDGVGLDIVAGETVALLGPNGAGKSTTLDILLGLTRPDGGEVSVFGRAPAEAAQSGLVGAMLQTGRLLTEVTVRELIALTASFYQAPMQVDEVLRRARTDGIANRRTNNLSGGQVQRVRFALALVPDPELLVLDEPTVGMDVEGRRAFWASMHELAAAGGTILFATHYLQEADEFADRVVLMARGRVVADGTAAAVKAIVGGRTIRCTLPGARPEPLHTLPGVTRWTSAATRSRSGPPTPTPPCARCSRSSRRRGTSRSPAPTSRTRSSLWSPRSAAATRWFPRAGPLASAWRCWTSRCRGWTASPRRPRCARRCQGSGC